MKPFDFSNSILNGKEIEFDQITKKDYNSFIVNRALSMYIDGISQANQMNIHFSIDNDMKYKYLYYSVRKKKRPFAKWPKASKSDYIDSIKEYYSVSFQKAIQISKILTEENLKEIDKIVKSRQQ